MPFGVLGLGFESPSRSYRIKVLERVCTDAARLCKFEHVEIWGFGVRHTVIHRLNL